MAIETINIPDIGGAEGVDVIEVCVAVGDTIEVDTGLLVLESDKASMDIPSPKAGVVTKVLVKEGDKVSEGAPMFEIETSATSAPAAEAPPGFFFFSSVSLLFLFCPFRLFVFSPPLLITYAQSQGVVLSGGPGAVTQPSATAAPAATSAVIDIPVPDIGGAEHVDVIEVCVAVGDEVKEGDSLIVLESDKASMDIPSPVSGKITALSISVGDTASMGTLIGKIETTSSAPAPVAAPVAAKVEAPAAKAASAAPAVADAPVVHSGDVYAGPAVRKLARQLGVNLGEVKATGPRGRVLNDDVKAFVKTVMQQRASGGSSAGTVTSGSGIPAVPYVDYAQFGEIEMVKMSKIKQLTAEAMTRNWLNIPRVTQFDDADITDIENFRKDMKAEAEKSGVKLTPLPFIIKAAAAALQAEPSFNVAMHNDGEHIVQKKFIHIAVAVDTPRGLMVPVIRDVDKKGIYEISREVAELAGKARDGKLKPAEMQGGCFTISSLGPIGGTGFTPMVSTTEAGILGISKAAMKPVWNGTEFEPRLMLPLSLSYDHRAVNGSDAGRFLTYISTVLADVRRLLL
ncbi:MAG: dihydrolipoyllysine-residue acetyltransferase [Marinagarivorans sp.]|nr:dihydrolipoyllysine-residue acetyltransferase [Marinagarivorans sp.]